MPKPLATRDGKLLEISPFGTGFIEDTRTGARYGFHVSMLAAATKLANCGDLTGRDVQFTVGSSGNIIHVTTDAVHTGAEM